MHNKSIALIGGGGFIGTNLSDFFMKEEYSVLVIGRSVKESDVIDRPNVKKKLIDVNKTSKLIDELYDYENVVWLVNDLVPSFSMDSLVDDFTFNINPLINFLESVDKLDNLKRFVFISSGGTIYGDSLNGEKIEENSPKVPLSAYGLSKLIAEEYIKYITQKSFFQSIILRPSNVYGNHQNFKKPQGIVGYAFNAILNGKSIDIYGDGNVTRDFIHVLDFAEALKLCIEGEFEKAKVDIYNVGSQEGFTIKQILNFINEITGINIQCVTKPSRSFDCNFNVLSTHKINTKFGWQPQIKINDGLESVWKWINSIENKIHK